MSSKKVAGISILAIFILGFVFGFAANRFFFGNDERHPRSNKHYRPNTVEKFTKELDLTGEQQEHLIKLLDKVKKQHSEIRKATHPEYERVRNEFREAFLEILTDEQKLKFLEFDERYNKRRKR